MIFVTVGTVAPFDRLIRAADALAASTAARGWHAQIGAGAFVPRHMSFDRFLSKQEFEARVGQAELIIAHGGVGIISDALRAGKPLLVLPRLARCGEHVNDHQVDTAKFFAENGHMLAANHEDDLASLFTEARAFVPTRRVTRPERVAERVGVFLRSVAES